MPAMLCRAQAAARSLLLPAVAQGGRPVASGQSLSTGAQQVSGGDWKFPLGFASIAL